VADDDERVRHATSDILQHEGYEVGVARDGSELMCAYREQPVDMIGAVHSQCIDAAEQQRGHAMCAAPSGRSAAVEEAGQDELKKEG
jgi:CheY-like chemotaxis protein